MWIKTSELTGAALDWAVAQVTGIELDIIDMPSGPYIGIKGRTPDGFPRQYCPSTGWIQGGPLIERYMLGVCGPAQTGSNEWEATPEGVEETQYGRSFLEAAMRAIVASELGDEADVPEELL